MCCITSHINAFLQFYRILQLSVTKVWMFLYRMRDITRASLEDGRSGTSFYTNLLHLTIDESGTASARLCSWQEFPAELARVLRRCRALFWPSTRHLRVLPQWRTGVPTLVKVPFTLTICRSRLYDPNVSQLPGCAKAMLRNGWCAGSRCTLPWPVTGRQ